MLFAIPPKKKSGHQIGSKDCHKLATRAPKIANDTIAIAGTTLAPGGKWFFAKTNAKVGDLERTSTTSVLVTALEKTLRARTKAKAAPARGKPKAISVAAIQEEDPKWKKEEAVAAPSVTSKRVAMRARVGQLRWTFRHSVVFRVRTSWFTIKPVKSGSNTKEATEAKTLVACIGIVRPQTRPHPLRQAEQIDWMPVLHWHIQVLLSPFEEMALLESAP